MWEKIQKAYEAVESGLADRIDNKEYNFSVYKAGTIIRLDVKGVFI